MTDLLAALEREQAALEPLAPPPLHRRIRWRRLCATMAALAVFTALVVEVALRVAGKSSRQPAPAQQWRQFQKLAGLLSDAAQSPGLFVPDSRLLWKFNPGHHYEGCVVAPGGYLGVAPGVPPLSGALRLLVLGDDLAAGTYRPWPVALSRLARLSADGPRLELANAAVPGHSVVQIYRRWSAERAMRPALVAICEPSADLDPPLAAQDGQLGWSGPLARVWISTFGRFAIGNWLAGAAPGGEHRVGPEERVAIWTRLLLDVDASGAAILIIRPPHVRRSLDDGLIDRVIEQYQRAKPTKPLEVLDLRTDFLRRQRNHLVAAPHEALTPPGHNLVARLVMGRLLSMGLIQPKQMESAVRSAWYDSAAPDQPEAQWKAMPTELSVAPETTAPIGLALQNTGNTRFLSRHIVNLAASETLDVGTVTARGQIRWEPGGAVGGIGPLELPRDLLPGESTTWTLETRVPAGALHAELDLWLEATAIGPLDQFGPTRTSLRVRVVRPSATQRPSRPAPAQPPRRAR